MIDITSQRSNHTQQSSSSGRVSRQSQLSLNDEQINDNNDTNDVNDVDYSEDEEASLNQQAEHNKKKPLPVWSYFDSLDENLFLCNICCRVSEFSQQ